MTIEQSSVLPLGDDFPVAVQITIHAINNGYLGTLQVGLDRPVRMPISLREHDVQDLNDEIQRVLEHTSASFEGSTDSSSQQEAMQRLAQIGRFAYLSVFPSEIIRTALSHALKMGTTIQVTSDEFFIPWELLYVGELDGPVNLDDFWGMNYIVSRAIPTDIGDGLLVSPILRTALPHIGLATCNELSYVVSAEIPALEKLQLEHRILLERLRTLHTEQRVEEIREFNVFLRKRVDIIHLACHAYQQHPLSRSFLVVEENFEVSIQDFTVHEFYIENNPLVILNACRTGTMNPLSTANWARLFWERGARGVLATEFRVPDSFAARFTPQLYESFLAGTNIGESLLRTRRHFWETDGNPLGLAYALYSSPSIRIQK